MDMDELSNPPDISKEKKTFGKRFAVYYLDHRIGTVVAADKEQAKVHAENNFETEVDGENIYLDYEGYKGDYEGDDGNMHLDIFPDIGQLAINEASQYLKLEKIV